MSMRIIGSILLIVAMSIGAGLLALPVATAAGGFFYSCLLLVVIWLTMTMGALFLVEVSLWLPKDCNLVSMAGHTLGVPGKIITWISYLLLLYCLLCVFISGGTDLFNSIWQSWHVNVYSWFSSVLFTLIFGAVVWQGIKLIDRTNRLLMSSKMVAYAILVVFLLPTIKLSYLPKNNLLGLEGAVMPVIFSFGYAIIVPSLRGYLPNVKKLLPIVIAIGSMIPLLCYIIWNYVIQGTISQQHLIAISHSGQVVSQLNAGLSKTGNPWIITISHLFTSICVLTSFLAVSLSLTDFIADGIKKKKEGKNKILIHALAFGPPLMIIIFKPYIYMKAIHYAGLLCVIILMLLPTLMVAFGRAKFARSEKSYQAPGGKVAITLMIIISIGLLGFAVSHLI